MKKPAKTPPVSTPKSASITLRAAGSTMLLSAVQRPNGITVTSVTTRDAEKKTTRGMTEVHKDMPAARAHLDALAKQAEQLGWQRGRFGAAKPDAFSKLPAAPKAAVDTVQR